MINFFTKTWEGDFLVLIQEGVVTKAYTFYIRFHQPEQKRKSDSILDKVSLVFEDFNKPLCGHIIYTSTLSTYLY